MRELEPGARKRVGKLLGVGQKAARDLLVGRVKAQRQVGGEHGGHQLFRRVVGVRDRRLSPLGRPLVGACRALGQLPLVAKQVLKIVVAPLRRRGGPGHFQAAGDRVAALARAVAALPAQALLFDACAFGLLAYQRRIACAVGLAKSVAAGDERHGFFIVHGHARKGVADVARGSEGVGVAVRAFGVHIDQAHLHGGQRVGQIALAAVALVAAEPGRFSAPVHVLIGFPHVGAATRKTEGLEAHGFERHVPGQDHQVGPRNLAAIFLLDRPEQATRLVQIGVVGPAVERRKALLPCPGATPAVGQAVGARAVPGHADKQRAIVAKVCGPPVLRVGHQRPQVGLHGGQVKALEFLGVVEALSHRVGERRVLVQGAEIELVGPPVGIAGARGRGLGVVKGALGFCRHGSSPVKARRQNVSTGQMVGSKP